MSAVNWRTKATGAMLLERALMLKNIRAFFDRNGVIEVETPLLSHHSITDPHLDSLQSRFRDQTCYLNTSPEFAMKRLLASWHKPIYQICKAFRDDELGPNHNPEFSMLEWYRPGYDMMQLMDEVTALIEYLSHGAKLSSVDAALLDKPRFEWFSYQQAFEDIAGFNPHCTSSDECYQVAIANQIEIPQGLGLGENEVNDWLDWLLTQLIFPAFHKDRFTLLYDYPAAQCALAKVSENEQHFPVAKRFELFYGEVELANGFHELTDSAEQLRRFQQENRQRKLAGKQSGSIDMNLIAALDHGLPDCAGVAMGLDRLLMALTGSSSIEKVLTFSWENA